eukprot:5798333-Pyramimonas_sp.AAC.1
MTSDGLTCFNPQAPTRSPGLSGESFLPQIHIILCKVQWGPMPRNTLRASRAQGALGLLGIDGFAMKSVTFPQQKSMDALGAQGWASRG